MFVIWCRVACLVVFLVGTGNGVVEVSGDDTCVNVIDQCGVVGVMLGEIVGEGDEACVGESWVHMGGRGFLGEVVG